MTQTPVRPNSALVYKMRDLTLRTAQVMREINESGQPALITLRGRFVAKITPLVGVGLEDKLISAALEADDAAEFGQWTGAGSGRLRSTEEVAGELGVEIPKYQDRDVAR